MIFNLTNITEIFQFLGILCFVFLLGSISTLVIVAYLFQKYLSFSSILYKKSASEYKSVRYSKLLKENLVSPTSINSTESCRFLNILLAFIFKEWRDTATVQRWIIKKVNVEIEELLETKAAKRLLQSVKINDINIGTSPPVIHGITIKEPCTFSSAILPDRIIIDIDIEYEGGFYLAVDVDLLFGKSAFLSIIVKHMKGQIRLQFNRNPCTHWSVSFVDEPTINIQIETNFLSRPFPQLGSLILNQVYRTIRRKHTFPRYKIRYTPFNAFWVDDCTLDTSDDSALLIHKMEVTIPSCTRLLLPHFANKRKQQIGICGVVYVTLSVDAISCEGLDTLQSDASDSKKSNFLLTSIADALGETDEQLTKHLPESPRIASALLQANPIISTSIASPATPENREEEAYDDNNNSKEQAKNETEVNTSNASTAQMSVDECRESGRMNETSYMMVTRNFSAILSERPFIKPTGTSVSNVHVSSVMWSRNAGMKPTISEGDRILSINGHSIQTLSQAIAVIKDVRAKKARFYFKVQRNRRHTNSFRSMNEAELSRNRAISSPVKFPFDDSQSSDENETPPLALDEDTESDFTDLDAEDQESYVNEGFVRTVRNPKNFLTPTSSPIRNVRQHLLGEIINNTPRHVAVTGVMSSTDDDLKFAQVTSTSIVVKTGFCDCLQTEYDWSKDTFTFNVESGHKYLNARFWYQEIATTSTSKKDNLTLVGSVGVPLQCVQRHCKLVGSGTFIRRYKVTSPLVAGSELRSNASRIFKQRCRFKLEHCYGDVTISTKIIS